MEFVSGDYDIPNIWKIKNVPSRQPDYVKYNGNRIGNIMGIKWEWGMSLDRTWAEKASTGTAWYTVAN